MEKVTAGSKTIGKVMILHEACEIFFFCVMCSITPFPSHQDIFSKDTIVETVLFSWMEKCIGKGLKQRAGYQEGPVTFCNRQNSDFEIRWY